MNFEQWELETEDPWKMLSQVHVVWGGVTPRVPRQITPRKVRLILCALARIHWMRLSQIAKDCITTAESCTEGAITDLDMDRMSGMIELLKGSLFFKQSTYDSVCAWTCAPDNGPEGIQCGLATLISKAPSAIPCCDILRCLVKNPYQMTFTCDETPFKHRDVLAIAEVIHRDRDYSLMPQLGDALQDAGCDETLVLDHCAYPHRHHLGCWVIDYILNKR